MQQVPKDRWAWWKQQHIKDSLWVTWGWNRFTAFISRSSEWILVFTILYTGASMVPGVGNFPPLLNIAAAIAQQLSLDISAVSMVKTSLQLKRAGKDKEALYARNVCVALVSILICTLLLAVVRQVLSANNTPMYPWLLLLFEGVLLLSRAIMSVFYGLMLAIIHDDDKPAIPQAQVIQITEIANTLAEVTKAIAELAESTRNDKNGLRNEIADLRNLAENPQWQQASIAELAGSFRNQVTEIADALRIEIADLRNLAEPQQFIAEVPQSYSAIRNQDNAEYGVPQRNIRNDPQSATVIAVPVADIPQSAMVVDTEYGIPQVLPTDNKVKFIMAFLEANEGVLNKTKITEMASERGLVLSPSTFNDAKKKYASIYGITVTTTTVTTTSSMFAEFPQR